MFWEYNTHQSQNFTVNYFLNHFCIYFYFHTHPLTHTLNIVVSLTPEKESSAPKFLKEMYQSLWDEATGDLKATQDAPITIEGQLLPKNSIRSFTRADKIVSFTNQSKYLTHLTLSHSLTLHLTERRLN